MNYLFRKIAALILAGAISSCISVRAQSADPIGVIVLQSATTNLNGTGVRVAQPEAGFDLVTNWEVNPVDGGRLPGLITYISADGSTTNFPNGLSSGSGHAAGVAQYFYGLPNGVATNVAHVDNYDVNYFYNSIIAAVFPANIGDPVVNQSFIFCEADYSHMPVSDEQNIDSQYDDYAARYKTLFISGAGNGGPTNQSRVYPAATCYNGIGVAAYGGNSCTGPTLDNGRAKPDITAPAGITSFSTPQVAGAAAVLLQASLRGDGGSDTNSAADIRTLKALLLNGAIKPADWTNSNSSPLDARYGAGVLNVFNSYKQLAGDKHGYIASTSVAAGGAHPPTGATGTIGVLSGWDFNTNSSSSFPSAQDGVNHYYFNVTNSVSTAAFSATATLVWNRQQNQTGINNLDLFLYDAISSNLVAFSTSVVDNVEHIFVPRLPQGRYDLQVLMNASGINPANNSEAYALAWEFFSTPLNIAQSGISAVLSWPVYPAGFTVMTTSGLAPANWTPFTSATAVITNQQNLWLLNPTNASQFFRLQRP